VRQAEAIVVVANEASLSRALRKDKARLRHRCSHACWLERLEGPGPLAKPSFCGLPQVP
jgi:hypothetical protein